MPTALENVFYKNVTIESEAGCTIEYNMNSMIDGITVSNLATDADKEYIDGISDWPTNKGNPFKKLFPVDAIIKPFRPTESGIKYYIGINDTPADSFSQYRTVQYPNSKPRIYYPGVTTNYKYWLGAKGKAINIKVKYKQDSVVTGNKAALANKIVIKFEKYHSLPGQYKVTIVPVSGSDIVIPYASTSTGVVEIYYNGSSWTTSKPSQYATPIKIKSIQVEATNTNANKHLAIIEISARWIKDISSDIVSFDITKESSSSTEELLPVGYVTANSMSLSLNKYNQSSASAVEYVRNEVDIDPAKLYMVKNAELKPYIKIYHADGTLPDSYSNYDRVEQGTYYIDTYSIEEYGDIQLQALDSSKYLMETLCPDIFCERFPATAILRNLLDAVGFTNYNFNLTTDEINETTDDSKNSIPNINFWWTNDSSTVWEAIQELCRDIQMNAFVDDNNVLQFYSRNYIYDSSREVAWNFYADTEGNTAIANIFNFTKKEIASANSVKVLWQSPISSSLIGSSDPLWQAPTTFLTAGALKEPVSPTSDQIVMEFSEIDQYSKQQSLYNFTGYLLIDSEIIEFEAIGYDYTDLEGVKHTNQWAYSAADATKYLSLSKPGYEDIYMKTPNCKPSGAYKVKQKDGVLTGRGALGTVAASHSPSVAKLDSWTGQLVTWK